jgi:hypothetical protein
MELKPCPFNSKANCQPSLIIWNKMLVPVKFRESFFQRIQTRFYYWFYRKQIKIMVDEMNDELRNIYLKKNTNEWKGETWTRES